MWAGGHVSSYVVARAGSISHGVYWHNLKKGLAKGIQKVMNKFGGAPPSSRVPMGEDEIRGRKIARLLLDRAPTYRTDRSDAGWLVLRRWLTGIIQRRSPYRRVNHNEYSDLIPVSALALLEIL